MKEFKIKVGNIKNITLFNVDKKDVNTDNIFIAINNKQFLFEIFDIKYHIKYIVSDIDLDCNANLSIPLIKFQDIVKKFKDDEELIIRDQEEFIEILINKNKYLLKKMNNEKPEHKEGEDKGEIIKINTEKFLKGLKKTRFAICNEKTKYYLNGINVEFYKNSDGTYSNRAISTTGKILAIYSNVDSSSTLIKKNNILSKEVVNEVIKILENASEEIKISFYDNRMYLEAGNFICYFKLIEAEYPNVDAIIPNENNKIIKINNNKLKDQIDKVSLILVNDEKKDVKLSFAENKLEISTSNFNGDKSIGSFDIEYNDEKIEIRLNCGFLSDILTSVEDENIIFKIKDNKSAILITEEKDDKFKYLIMPVYSD